MKKKFFYLFVCLVAFSLLFTVSCKKAFDITGTWDATGEWTTPPLQGISGKMNVKITSATPGISKGAKFEETWTFQGSTDSGTFSTSETANGTYTVDNKTVRFVFNNGTTYDGTAHDDNHMSGTMKSNSGWSGTWDLTR